MDQVSAPTPLRDAVDRPKPKGVSPNRAAGIRLALVAALLWGWLPIALSALLDQLDAITITWTRFTMAALVQNLWLLRIGRSPWPWRGDRRNTIVAVVAACTLIGNYVLAASSLHFLTPDASILVAQAQPLLLVLAGSLFFGERLSRAQGVGVALLAIGLLMFFHRSVAALIVPAFPHVTGVGTGVALAFGGAVSWAAYAILQRMLRRAFSPQQTLALLYAAASLLLWPWARPSSVLALDTPGVCLLAFCIANTLLAYGAFAQAMAHTSAAVVGAIIAQSPLVTIATLASIAAVLPDTEVGRASLTPLALFGVLLVVGGCTLCVRARHHGRAERASSVRDDIPGIHSA